MGQNPNFLFQVGYREHKEMNGRVGGQFCVCAFRLTLSSVNPRGSCFLDLDGVLCSQAYVNLERNI